MEVVNSGEETLLKRSIRITGVVALYWAVSISMVFLNKHLLSNVDMKAPIFVTCFQALVAVAACFFFGYFNKTVSYFSSFPDFEYDLSVAKKVLPLSVVFVGMITFNNLCLKEVGVPFYNVGRSLTTLFNIMLSYFVLGQSTSIKALAMCGIIVSGFFMGVDQEGSLSFAGVVYGILASACVALNAIYIKKVLPFVDNNMWKLTAYNNANAFLLFIPVIIILGEVPLITSSTDAMSLSFWLLMTLAGIFGIAIGLVTMLQIQVTSPVTHNISGTAKACAQTILALQLKGEVRTGMWWLGNLFVLGGSLGYAIVKRQEMKKSLEAASNKSMDRV
eukprot:m.6040 g.6040  ORF g.6040 m.6040 type:complete len:333 (-) comp2535_c0_seq1:373-1371(-)